MEGGSGASGPLQMLEYGKFWLQHASLVLYITHVFTGNLVREMKLERCAKSIKDDHSVKSMHSMSHNIMDDKRTSLRK